MGDTTAPETGSPGSSDIPTALQISPQSVTIEIGQRVQFRGHTQKTSRRISVPVAVTWEASGGSILSDGLFSSASAGTFKVIGRGRGRKLTDTSVVVVVPPATDLVRIAVAPDPVVLDAGSTRSFTATGYLADGSTAAIGVNWSATGGEVDPAGVYVAGLVGGSYRVIATNTSGTLADTAAVTIDPPVAAAPTLASVVLSPASATLTQGGSKQFHAYGRTSAGDSVAVPVVFTATGGTITSTGLYTAGQTTGTFRIIAASNGLADTAVVTLTVALASGDATGIPYGPYNGWSTTTTLQPNSGSFTLSIDGYSASTLLDRIAAARAAHRKLILNLTGGAHDNYLTNGVFDPAKWGAKMETFNTSAIRNAMAAAVLDGTVIGESVMDEPNTSGLGDGNTWGPAGTMTKVRVDSLCGVVQRMFPSLPVGVAHNHTAFEPTKGYRVCDFILSQYSARFGSVTAFRDGGLQIASRDGHAILFAMNLLDGGVQDRDGTWDCTGTGGLGTRSPNCRMTADQVRDWGITLGSAGSALVMWRYDATFASRTDNQQAFRDVAARLASLPAKSFRRTPSAMLALSTRP
ncbi:MAG: hypothetical protein ACJ8DC_14085 [Gemmatimonadales bacterium]